jgi:hypothetical protein
MKYYFFSFTCFISSLLNIPLPLMHLIATNFAGSLTDVLRSKVEGRNVGQVDGRDVVQHFPDFDLIEDTTKQQFNHQLGF